MLPSLEEFFRSVAGDPGLAKGAALSVLSLSVRDRGEVQVPWDGDDRAGWRRMKPHGYVLVGAGAERAVAAAGALTTELWDAPPPPSRLSAWPQVPSFDEGLILIPAGRASIVNGSTGPGRLSSEVAYWLRAFKTRTQPRIVVRLDAQAAKDWQGVVKDAAREKNFGLLHSRLQRWVNVAALLAIGRDPERPIVTRELLVAAHQIAIVNHEVTWEMVQQYGTGLPVH